MYATKRNYPNITARDGQQAVEAYITACALTTGPQGRNGMQDFNAGPIGKPQVCLMDINMPVLNGFEATRRIREFEQQHNLEPATVIALTGLGSASAQQEAYSSGVDLFLTKPVRLKELTKILEGITNA